MIKEKITSELVRNYQKPFVIFEIIMLLCLILLLIGRTWDFIVFGLSVKIFFTICILWAVSAFIRYIIRESIPEVVEKAFLNTPLTGKIKQLYDKYNL